MKEIRVEDAVGQVLCHDVTEIVRGVSKGAKFKKGHVITVEDVPELLKLGKENVFVWEADSTKLHENEAAEILRETCQGDGLEATPVSEGKIELKAAINGVFHVDAEKLNALNNIDEICIATLQNKIPVRKGKTIAGMRVIPLIVDKFKMERTKTISGGVPILKVMPYKKLKVGLVVTGSEIYHERIKDTFTPVIESKLRTFGLEVNERRVSDDTKETTRAKILELVELGMELILCTGGMSVDPDDRTPAAIKSTGAEVVTYGVPVLPGAMFMLAYLNRQIPIMGLPGCVMFCSRTIFDLILPRVLTGEVLTRRELKFMGIGGLL